MTSINFSQGISSAVRLGTKPTSGNKDTNPADDVQKINHHISASEVLDLRQDEVNDLDKKNTYGNVTFGIMSQKLINVEELNKSWKVSLSNIDGATNSMKNSYANFKKSLSYTNPALAKKDFGFSVDSQGNLIATKVTGKDKEELTKLLNKFSDLKYSANQYAQGIIDFVNADSAWGFGKYNLSLNNFQSTIDIGQELDVHLNGSSFKGAKISAWMFQLTSNGEIDRTKVDAWKPIKVL